MHAGRMTTQTFADWARAEGASPESARALGRLLVGRFAGRPTDAVVSKKLALRAEAAFAFDVLEAVPAPAADGTVRFAVRLSDGQVVESVAIAHEDRTTVCLSTQAGCARGCVFCETGRLGLSRQLAPEEVTGQFAAVCRHLDTLGRPRPTNVVFMGMGEPLDNLDAVLDAAAVLADDCGFAVPARRITVSTVGVVPKMRELYRRSKLRLAVSLHAATDEERMALLPVARTWNLAALKAAVSESPQSVLLQWTLIEGVNDSDRHVRDLLAFCDGLDARVNLIPLNPGPEDQLRAPPMERVRAFQKQLADAGVRTLVRMPHGQEVGGACGQLAGAMRETPELKPRLPVIGRAR
jgi:23S rRNA (adenine2503-C2)-methyltransferase